MTRRSVVVTQTVRLLGPFVLTFGLFTAFHGTSSVGGGFQAGAVVAALAITFAFAFGLRETRAWLGDSSLVALAVAGVVAFAAVAVAPLAFDGGVLDLRAVPLAKGVVYAVELAELGIAATVAGTVISLFFALAGTDVTDGANKTDGADGTGGAGEPGEMDGVEGSEPP